MAVYDLAGNFTTVPFTVVRDVTAPTASLSVPSRTGEATFLVTWLGGDGSGSGVATYNIQVSEDDGETWADWQVDTPDTQATYEGQFGHRYTFRARAADNVGNVGLWSESAATTVVQVTKYYHFGAQRACPECNRRVAMRQGDVVYYLHGDHLGSTSVASTSGGALHSRQLYYPYGETRYASAAAAASAALPTDFGFTGQRDDGYIKLYQMGARWYNPVIGRWISADTLVPDPVNPQDFNRYAYVRNNPLRYTDPTGHLTDRGDDPGGAGATPQMMERYYRNQRWWRNTRSLIVDFIPIIGDVKGLVEAFTGKDSLSGQELGGWRWLGLLGLSELRRLRNLRHLHLVDEGVDLLKLVAKTLIEVGPHTDEGAELVRILAKASTRDELVEGGFTLLGSFPEYVDLAKLEGLTHFDMPKEVWDLLKIDDDLVWAVNKQFLDDAIAAGNRFVVTLGEGKVPGKYLQREIEHLLKKGYELVDGIYVPKAK